MEKKILEHCCREAHGDDRLVASEVFLLSEALVASGVIVSMFLYQSSVHLLLLRFIGSRPFVSSQSASGLFFFVFFGFFFALRSFFLHVVKEPIRSLCHRIIVLSPRRILLNRYRTESFIVDILVRFLVGRLLCLMLLRVGESIVFFLSVPSDRHEAHLCGLPAPCSLRYCHGFFL